MSTELLALYRKLHDGLSDMVEGGRLTEEHIPDDYRWLVESLAKLAALDPEGHDPVASSVSYDAEQLRYFAAARDHGWAVGDEGLVLRTSNRGEDWTVQISGVPSNLLGVRALATQRAVAVDVSGLFCCTASLMPSFRRNEIIGHQFVKPDWSRFNPTNSVNQRKYGCTYVPSNTLAATNVPAIARNIGSRVIAKLLFMLLLPEARSRSDDGGVSDNR